jgi:hypothetical protein
MNQDLQNVFDAIREGMRIKCPRSIKTVVQKCSDRFVYKMEKGRTQNPISLPKFVSYYNRISENGSIDKDWFLKNIKGHDCDFYVIGSILVERKLANYSGEVYQLIK